MKKLESLKKYPSLKLSQTFGAGLRFTNAIVASYAWIHDEETQSSGYHPNDSMNGKDGIVGTKPPTGGI